LPTDKVHEKFPQKVESLPNENAAGGFISLTLMVSLPLHPFCVTVTQYFPAVVTIIEEDDAPVFH
jgi:hypothetical protein